MPDLLTPDELAVIAEREAKATEGPWMLRHDGWTIRDSKGERQIAHTYGRDGALVEQQVSDAEFIAEARADIPALLPHIAALEARTPAPTLPTFDLHGEPFKPLPILALPDQQKDLAPEIQRLISKNMDALAEKPAPALPAALAALLADAGYKAVLAALRQEAVDKCGGGFGAPDLNADYQLSLSLLVREVYQILNIEQHIDALATALRETLAERDAERVRAEKAEAERDQMCEAAQVGKDRWQDAAEQLAEAQADLAAARKELAGLKVDLNAKSAENAGYLAALEHLECCCFLPQSDEERAHRAVLRAVILNPTGSRTCVCSNKNYNDQNCPLHSSAVKKAWEERSARAIRRVLEGGAS